MELAAQQSGIWIKNMLTVWEKFKYLHGCSGGAGDERQDDGHWRTEHSDDRHRRSPVRYRKLMVVCDGRLQIRRSSSLGQFRSSRLSAWCTVAVSHAAAKYLEVCQLTSSRRVGKDALRAQAAGNPFSTRHVITDTRSLDVWHVWRGHLSKLSAHLAGPLCPHFFIIQT